MHGAYEQVIPWLMNILHALYQVAGHSRYYVFSPVVGVQWAAYIWHTRYVVWPRYREGNAGIIDAGLEDSFSSLYEISHCCVKPQMREGMEGRLMSEPMGG